MTGTRVSVRVKGSEEMESEEKSEIFSFKPFSLYKFPLFKGLNPLDLNYISGQNLDTQHGPTLHLHLCHSEPISHTPGLQIFTALCPDAPHQLLNALGCCQA